ncbi:MAG: hypothetical protein FWC89_00350 [Defluviitaleaceae bacterium]|nr:hypothetical protein [Defluviitaleaceae bacterium]
MKNTIKRTLALWLGLMMLFGLVPITALAAPPDPSPPASERPWRQRPVSDATIVVNPAQSGGTSYSFNIMWSRPHLSQVLDMRVGEVWLQQAADLGFWTIFPTHYLINFRNATRNEVFGANPVLPPINVPAPAGGQDRTRPPGMALEVSTGQRQFTMRPASLYEIHIDPVRPIPILLPPPPGSPPYAPSMLGSTSAPIDNAPGLPAGRDLLFLTDITPEVQGRNNIITVTWEEPTFNGMAVFPYWHVSHVVYTGPPIAPSSGHVLPVRGPNAGVNEISRNPDGTLTATIAHPNIRPIGQYAIRIEPMLGPNPGVGAHNVRNNADGTGRASTDLSIGGRQFSLHFTQNDYVAIATMIPELHIEQAGVQFLRLWWPPLTAILGDISHVVVEEWPPEMEGVIPESAAGRLGTISTYAGAGMIHNNETFVGPGIPSERRGFSLAIHFHDGTVLRTEVVVFDPLVAEFSPYRPEIVHLDHVGEGRLSMEWLAFARFPAVPAEVAQIPEGDPYRGRFVDTALYYEIFVSDNWEDMSNMTTPLMTVRPGQLYGYRRLSPVQPEPLVPVFDPTWQLFPNQFITQYQTFTPQGIVTRDIRGNRVYFVRIRAVREPGGQASSWAYGSVYVPPLDPLLVTPEMISSPPVQIVTAEITETSIPLQWDIRYLEVMQPNLSATDRYLFRNPHPYRDVWHTVIGATREVVPNRPNDVRLIYGRSATYINFIQEDPHPTAAPRYRFLNNMINAAHRTRLLGLEDFPMNVNQPEEVAPFLRDARTQMYSFLSTEWGYAPAAGAPPMALRIQDTYNFSYQIHAVPYQTVRRTAGGFDAYRDSLNPAAWRSIGRPDVEDGVARHVVTGLTPNTPYIIFIRPYVMISGQMIHAAYPTYVIGTTVVVPDRPVPTPTTPVLFPVPRYTTRNQVGVRWRVQADMVYQLRISHLFTDYSAGGTPINISWEDVQAALDGEVVELENPRALLDVQYVGDVPYFHLRIQERFPYTTYYIWAFALGVDEDGNVQTQPSEPSNPVDIRTLDIEPPPPPRNLQRATSTILAAFNRYNSTTHRNDEPETLIISFNRIFADFRDDMGNPRPRATGGTASGGAANSLDLPNVPDTDAYAQIHLIRFAELRANRQHHVRARTILTVQRGQPDVYSYEIQVADNEDFLDAITFIIPPLVGLDPINMRRAHSVWVYVDLYTGVDDGDFDEAHHPDQYPLPERDWELTYDRGTQTLTWRFRTNQRGADGRLDQNVDQRFITQLVRDRVFTFTADMTSYNNMPISNREIIIPESIVRAFAGQNITFEILTGDTNILIPPGAFDTAQVRSLPAGVGTYYRIAINSTLAGMPPLQTNTEFATVPQRFSVTASTPNRSAPLTSFARPIGIVLPVEPHITPDGLRTGLFVNDTGTASWRDTQGHFNFSQNTLSATISNPTTFAGISRATPPMAAPNHPTNTAMERVSSRMTFTDMVAFNPNANVTANQFNNIVNALIHGNTSVSLSASLSPANARSLGNARLLAPQDLTQEVALDIMVRLYENRTRQILTPMSPAASIPGLQNANPNLHNNLRKAADIGFVTGPIEPNAPLTMGALMNMVDIIILDAGM